MNTDMIVTIVAFMIYNCVCNKINWTGATCEEGTTYPSGAPE